MAGAMGRAGTGRGRGSRGVRSVDEQLARVLDTAVRPAPVRVAITDAQGLLCEEEVVAQRSLPGFDQAAVDGYAVRSVDVTEVPVILPVVGEIGAAQVGLLAAVGRAKVRVHPRPRLSILSVGEELVDIDRTPGVGQVYDINSYSLAAAARDAGAEVHRVGIVSSDPSRLREAVESRLLVSEIVVVTGAVGGATGEQMCGALAELGPLDVERVAMHPGSVQGFGRLGAESVPTFLLPSNPMSALVVFEVVVRPLIRLALGKRNPHRRTITARLLSPVTSTAGRRGVLRGQLLRDPDTAEYLVQPLGTSGAHLLASLAEANCLILVDADTTEVPMGEQVAVSFL